MTRLALAAACALMLISGCGGDDDTAGGGSTPTPTQTATETAAPTEDGTATATATPSEPVASKELTIDGTPLRLELVSLRRAGALAELELLLTNAQPPDAAADRFQAGGLFEGPEPTEGDSNVDGIYFVDPVNRKKYPVATDSDGICVCSDLSSELLEPGDAVALTATYGAPPEDVTQVDVSVPKFGTFRDVAIE
jgi:hypothetical protein